MQLRIGVTSNIAHLLRPEVCSFQRIFPHRLGVVARVVVSIGAIATRVFQIVVDADAVGAVVHREVQKGPQKWIFEFPSVVGEPPNTEVYKLFVDAFEHVVDLHK